MDDIKLLLELLKSYGLVGLVVCVLLWDKFIKPMRKKSSGNDGLKMLEARLNGHLEKEALEEARFQVLENKMANIEKIQDKQGDHIEKIFTLVSKIKDSMIEMGYGKRGDHDG